MTNFGTVSSAYLLVGDFVDEAPLPENLTTPVGGEVVRTQVVSKSVDSWGNEESLREFTVLLKDGRIVTVRGHGLKHLPHAVAGQDVFSIVVRTGMEEVLVALFKSGDVAGVFHGDICAERRIA